MIPIKQLLLVLLTMALFSCHTRQAADLILYHAKIYTVDSAFSTAQAIAIKDGKILATGTDESVDGSYTAPKTLDLGGQFIYPGS